MRANKLKWLVVLVIGVEDQDKHRPECIAIPSTMK